MRGRGRALAVGLLLCVIGTAGAGAGAATPEPAATYVVVLKPGTGDVRRAAESLAHAHGGALGFVYEHALQGFSIRVPAAAAASIARAPGVAYVEPDRTYAVTAQTIPTGVRRAFAATNPTVDIDGSDDVRVDVDVAVIDTGIDLDHPDLVVAGSTSCLSGSCSAGGDDGNGHGTHVAGSIGALDDGSAVVGMAPGARLWAVRVLNDSGSGTTSSVVAGIDWVAARAGTIEVANMSLGGSPSQAIDDAANRLADAGVAVAVAAGNSSADASGASPARAAKVLTVSALADFDGQPGGTGATTCRIDRDDTLADFSNRGTTVELAAPGVCILSTWLNGGTHTISGTSMASPHAAGALALLASKGFARTWTGVQGLYATLQSNGNGDWLDDSGDGVQEPLLDVSNATVFAPRTVAGPGAGGPPSPATPTVALAGAGTSSAKSWAATVTITVTTGASPTPGTAVNGTWSNGASGTSSCTTDAAGRCSVQKTGLAKRTGSVRFTVTSVGGSSTFGGTPSITVTKP